MIKWNCTHSHSWMPTENTNAFCKCLSACPVRRGVSVLSTHCIQLERERAQNVYYIFVFNIFFLLLFTLSVDWEWNNIHLPFVAIISFFVTLCSSCWFPVRCLAGSRKRICDCDVPFYLFFSFLVCFASLVCACVCAMFPLFPFCSQSNLLTHVSFDEITLTHETQGEESIWSRAQ